MLRLVSTTFTPYTSPCNFSDFLLRFEVKHTLSRKGFFMFMQHEARYKGFDIGLDEDPLLRYAFKPAGTERWGPYKLAWAADLDVAKVEAVQELLERQGIHDDASAVSASLGFWHHQTLSPPI